MKAIPTRSLFASEPTLTQIELNRRQLLRAVGFGSATVVLLAGCGGDDGDDGSGDTATKVLRVGTTSFGNDRMDPAADATTAQIICVMFDTAFRLDAEGQVVEGIVTGWEPSADGAAWTLTMRDDVVFHDGTKVTSEDLAYAYQRSVADTGDQQSFWLEVVGEEPNIEIVDETTIVVHTLGPQRLFIPMSTLYGSAIFLVPKALIEEKGLEAFVENPVGTGPYAFVKHDAASEMEFKAVDYDHWRVNPEFTEVHVLLTPESATAVAQLKTGELDMSLVSLEDSNGLRDEGFQIVAGPPQMIYFPIVGSMAPANEGKPTSDVGVRHALSYAINRQELIDTMFPGVGEFPGPIRTGLNHMPDITDALREKWQAWCDENYRYDVDEAKRLLADAGYADGFDVELWISPETAAPYLPDICQVVAGYWEKIGVKAALKNVSADAWERKRNAKDPGAAFGVIGTKAGSLAKASAGENVASNFISTGSDAALTGSPDEAKLDQAFVDYLSGSDEESEAALDTILTVAAESWGQLPIVQIPDLYAFGENVAPVEAITTFNVGDYYADWTVAG